MSEVLRAIERMRTAGLLGPTRARGCSEAELSQLEAELGMPLPTTYREFLLALGHGAGEFMRGSDLSYDRLRGIQAEAHRLVQGAGARLPPQAFVFLMHQGYQFLFFTLGAGDDPPIHHFSEGEAIRPLGRSLSQWIVESAGEAIESREGAPGLHEPRGETVDGKVPLGEEITPHVGACGVTFGMSRAEVTRVLGSPSREFLRGPFSSTPEWEYRDRGIIVSFDALGTCDALQLCSPCGPLLRGMHLLSMSATSAMAALHRLDPVAVLHADTLVSLRLGVALYAPEIDNHPDWPVSGMMAFRPDYYGSPDGEVG